MNRCLSIVSVALVSFLGGRTSYAQSLPADYVAVSDVRPYRGLSEAATLLTPSVGGSRTQALELPFDVTFFGQTYRTLYVNANGLVSVVPFGNGFNAPALGNPDVADPNGYVAVLWDDWCTDAVGCLGLPPNPDGGVYYEIDPALKVVRIEWRRLRHFRDAVLASDVTFQLVWFGGPTGRIELTYGNIEAGRDLIDFETEIRPRIGFESPDGLQGSWLAPCDQSQPCSTRETTFVDDSRIRLFQDIGPDLLVDDIQLPVVGLPGLPLPVETVVRNGHRDPVGPFRIRAYLVPASQTSTTGAIFAQSELISLQGYEAASRVIDIAVPDDFAEAEYRVVVSVDALDEVAEADEDNNTLISDILPVEGRGVDVTPVSLVVTPREVTAGQTVSVEYRIDNLGNEPATVMAQAYLSTNDFISTSDDAFGAAIEVNLAPRESRTGIVDAVVSAARRTGRYSVGLIADVNGTVAELDETNNVLRSDDDLLVRAADVALLTGSLPAGRVGLAYSVQLEAAGGDGDYRFAADPLPPGLALVGATLTGTPSEAGRFDVDLAVTSAGVQRLEPRTLVVDEDGLPLTPILGPLPEGFIGQDYAQALPVIGGRAPYRWRRVGGRLPDGLALSDDGRLQGVLREVGAFPVDLVVSDSAGASVATQIELTVRGGVNLTILGPTNLPAAELDQPYAQSLVASGGVPPRIWSAETVPPPGLTVTSGGQVVGIANVVGQYAVQVRVTDAVGATDFNTLQLEVRDDGRLEVVPERLEPAIEGQEYLAGLRAVGGRRPLSWTIDGSLPPGFVFEAADPSDSAQSDADRVVTGTAQASGLWAFRVQVVDDLGRSAERAYVVWIQTPPDAPAEDGCRCVQGRHSGSAGWGLFGLFLLAVRAIGWSRRVGDGA